jgi:hypothetical protein
MMYHLFVVVMLFTPTQYMTAVATVPEITFESVEQCETALRSESFSKVRLDIQEKVKATYIERYHPSVVEPTSVGFCGRKPPEPT